jgi:hypothetical protein
MVVGLGGLGAETVGGVIVVLVGLLGVGLLAVRLLGVELLVTGRRSPWARWKSPACGGRRRRWWPRR